TGEKVQAYWSQDDQAFIIPDGCKQTTYERPFTNWSTTPPQVVRYNDVPAPIQVTEIQGVTPQPSLLGLPANDMVDFNGHSYRARTDTVGVEHIRIQVDGSLEVELGGETARGNPSLAVFNNQLYIAWTGTDTGILDYDGHVNVAIVELDSTG